MMNAIQKRFLLFLIVCIGLRSFFVYLAKTLPNEYLRIMGFISLIPASGFLYIYLTGIRETGEEVFGDKIWWNDLRPIHSFLYFCFAYFAISEKHNIAWKFLLADVILGLSSFLFHHYKVGSFKNLIKL
jgi:hypothetical protein